MKVIHFTWCVICLWLGREARGQRGGDDGTGTVACPRNETLEEVQAQRLANLQKYVNAAGAIGPYRNWTLQETTMEGFLAPEANISVQGVGVFVGRQESIEYAALTNPTLNGNRLALLSRDIMNTTWLDGNKLQIYSNDTWQVNKTNEETGETWQAEIVQAVDQEFLTYLNCSEKIIDDHSVIDDAVNDAINTYVLSAVRPVDICFLSQIACAGDLYPFDNVFDCIQFMYSIPTSCDDGVNFLLGNTSYCRFLHATAAQVNPVIHCPHVRKDSTFCVQDQCMNQEYGPLPPPYFGEFSDDLWHQPAIIVVAFIIAFCPSILYGVSLILGLFEMKEICGMFQSRKRARFDKQEKLKDEVYDQEAATAIQRLTDTDTVDSISIELTNFKFQTSDGVTLLHSINMHVSGGELVAVMGPSGAGKTTLLKCLCGRQNSGKMWGTLNVGGGSGKFADVAFVEQNPAGMVMSKPELTVAESLASHATFLFKAAVDKEAKRNNKLQCVRQNVERVIGLMGIREFQNTKLKHLSGGQQKRYRIATELLSRPSGMLLDEPTSGLDSESALMLCNSLRSLASKGMLIIMNIHQPQDLILDLCSSVLLLKKGGHQALYESTKILRERIASAREIYNHFHFCPEEGREKGWIPDQSFATLVSSFALYDVSLKGRMRLENNMFNRMDEGDADEDLTLSNVAEILQQGKEPLDLENTIDILKRAAKDPSWIHAGEELRELASSMEEMTALPFSPHLFPPFLEGSVGETLLYMARTAESYSYLKSYREYLSFRRSSKEDKSAWNTTPEIERTLGLRQWFSINRQLSWEHWHGSPTLDMVTYGIGSFIAAGFLCLLFPFIGINSTRQIYGFPSSLLILIAISANLGTLIFRNDRVKNLLKKRFVSDVYAVFLNQILVRVSRERALLSHAFDSWWESSSLRVVNMLLCSSASNAISLVLMFFLYYFIVGWNVEGTEFARVVSSFISLKLCLDLMTIFGTIVILYLPQPAALAITGTWLGWNVVFAGVLIRLKDAFVLWKYWSFYITPFYHLINQWMWQAFYLVENLKCLTSQVPGVCPQTGNLVLEDFGYNAVPSGISMIVLMSTEILYACVLALLMLKGKRLYSAM